MNKLTKQEIAYVYNLYNGCAVQWNSGLDLECYLNSCSTGKGSPDNLPVATINVGDSGMALCDVLEFKLLVTPLPKITEEHCVENYHCHVPKEQTGMSDERKITYIRKNINEWTSFLDWVDYLFYISKGYDVKLFFGQGHWANGKTAIELGIAIDKTLPPANT